MPNTWHDVHLASRAVGGASLVFTEATAVVRDGRISPGDTGIWNDAQAEAWARIAQLIDAGGAVPGIQLAHAGRKAGTDAPWRGGGRLAIADGGWQPVAPSAIPVAEGEAPPTALDAAGIREVIGGFRDAAERAAGAGFRVARDPRSARLPAARVPLAAHEPTHRRVRRQLREPDAAGARGRRRGSRGLAGRAAALGADLGDRLGRRRLGHRRERRALPPCSRRAAST